MDFIFHQTFYIYNTDGKKAADGMNENPDLLFHSRWHFWASRNTMVTSVNTMFLAIIGGIMIKNIVETFLKSVPFRSSPFKSVNMLSNFAHIFQGDIILSPQQVTWRN